MYKLQMNFLTVPFIRRYRENALHRACREEPSGVVGGGGCYLFSFFCSFECRLRDHSSNGRVISVRSAEERFETRPRRRRKHGNEKTRKRRCAHAKTRRVLTLVSVSKTGTIFRYSVRDSFVRSDGHFVRGAGISSIAMRVCSWLAFSTCGKFERVAFRAKEIYRSGSCAENVALIF